MLNFEDEICRWGIFYLKLVLKWTVAGYLFIYFFLHKTYQQTDGEGEGEAKINRERE